LPAMPSVSDATLAVSSSGHSETVTTS
jgi:hypothetical protein